MVPSHVLTPRTGTVETFDDHVGSGTVRDRGDDRTWWFHCTRIADGSRVIAPGTEVRFVVSPGPTGLEAVDVAADPDPTATVPPR